ncbi:MAG: hypothetical protein RMA76_14910 [Deltaproteobacteria bacterium]|jgi:uncharacterized protein YqcC (DUF446 family)
MTQTGPTKQKILARIADLESQIRRAHEYLQTGAHAHWHGFRPLFNDKIQNGRVAPPHKDWVRSVFLPRRERLLRKAEKLLDRLEP